MKPLQRCAAWIVILWGVYQAKSFLIPLLLSALLAFLMATLIDLLRKKGLSEKLALILSSVLLFLPVVLIITLLLGESSVLMRDYPRLLAALKAHLEILQASSFIQRVHLSEYLDVVYLTDKLSEESGKGVSVVLTGLKALAEAGVYFFLIPFYSVLMLVSRPQLKRATQKLFTSHRTLEDIIVLIEKFLSARIVIALFVAGIDFVILKGLGSPYSVLLACFLGISTLIPIVGFLVAILPPIALSLAIGNSAGTIAIMVLLLYLVSTTEAHFVTPKLLGRQLNLNLLATFVGLFAGERIWGIWGIVLSIPILGILRIILESSPEFQNWAILLAEKDGSMQKSK
jgi:predicted PurR-regulated permease PerM